MDHHRLPTAYQTWCTAGPHSPACAQKLPLAHRGRQEQPFGRGRYGELDTGRGSIESLVPRSLCPRSLGRTATRDEGRGTKGPGTRLPLNPESHLHRAALIHRGGHLIRVGVATDAGNRIEVHAIED